MKKSYVRLFFVCVVFASLFLFWCVAGAEESESGQSFMDVLKGAVGEAANEVIQDQIDELKGTFAGEVSDIRLIERRGRSAIFEIRYKDVKDAGGLKLVGEVLRGGMPSDAFAQGSVDINDKRGKLRMIFEKGSGAADDGWGIATDSGPIQTDQIRLTFVRDTHPDEPFGQYVFDFSKTWTDSDEPDVIDAAAAEDESVTLAEGEKTATPPVLIRPGTSIKPAVVNQPVTLSKPKAVSQAASQTSSAASATSAMRLATIDASQKLLLNKYTPKALWQSGAGRLAFPGSTRNKQGYVRLVPEADLSTGNKAKDLLNTHPEFKSRGRIEGIYPAMKLGPNMHLKTVIGFLQGAGESDGARFIVSVKSGGRTRRVYAKRVTPQHYENVDIDLSSWNGKVVQLILEVDAGNHSRQDYAVWVKPRLDVVP